MADKSEQWFDRVFKLTGREKRLPRFPECERIILQGLLLTMQQLSRTTLPSSHLTGNPSISSNFFQHPFSVFSPTLKTFPCFPLLKFYPWFSYSLCPYQSPSALHPSPFCPTLTAPSFKLCPTLAPFSHPFRPVLPCQCHPSFPSNPVLP